MKPLSQIPHIPSKQFSSGPYLERLMAELDRASISARMKEARETAGLSQREIADALHAHWRTVQEWENVKNPNVPWDRLDEWARTTGRSREWLLHGEQAETAGPLTALAADVAELRGMVERLLALLPEAEEPPAGAGRP